MGIVDNRTQLQACDDNNDVAGDTTAAPSSLSTIVGTYIEGSNSIAFQVDDAQEAIWFDQDTTSTTFSLNLSDSTVYMLVKFGTPETYLGDGTDGLGGCICLKDGADGAGGDGIGYAVSGTDVAGFPYEYGFKGMKLDCSVVAATPGTNGTNYYQYFGTEAGLDFTAVLQVGFGSFSLVKAVSSTANAWIDGIYYIANGSYAATINGGIVTVPETMADIAGDDVTSGMGIINNPKGSEYGFFAPTQWGDTGTGSSFFTGTNEQWYWIGDNAGGHTVGATHFPFRLIGNATSTNSWVLNNVVIVNTGTKAEFDMSDSNMDIATMETCTLVDLGAITLPNATTKTTLSCVFVGCGNVTSNGGDMTGSSILTPNITTDTSGLIWNLNQDPDGELDDMTFSKTSGVAHHAIEFGTNVPTTMTLRGCDFTGFNASNGQNDSTFHFKDGSPTSITLNLINCTGNVSYKTDGADITIVEDPVTTLVNVRDHLNAPYLGARVLLIANGSPGDLPYQEVITTSRTGGTVTVTHTAHGFSVGQKVYFKGSNIWEYNGVKTITAVGGANSYDYEMSSPYPDNPSSVISATAVILEGLTDSSGQISDSRTLSTDQPVIGKIRKATSSPFYKEAPLSGTIDSVTGLTINTKLILDE